MARPKLPPNTYKFIDEQTIELDLTQNQTCLIDACDYDLVKDYRWYYRKPKKANSGYVLTSIPNNGKRKTLQIHRLIMNCTDRKMQIDHINHNGTDNRRSNLRICTNQENIMNTSKHKDNTSNYKGVSFHKQANKYRAEITFNKKRIHLGLFEDVISAAHAYDNKALELYGEFANLNFPNHTTI